jgi:hypothetical protein
VCIFLGRALVAPQIKKAAPSSKSKVYHILHIKHRDEVEAPITDWLREAYDLQDVLARESEARCGRQTSESGDREAAEEARSRADDQPREAERWFREERQEEAEAWLTVACRRQPSVPNLSLSHPHRPSPPPASRHALASGPKIASHRPRPEA